MKDSLKKYMGLALCLFALFLGITYWPQVSAFLSLLLSAARPLLLGCAIAYIVNLLLNFYEKDLLSGWKGKQA